MLCWCTKWRTAAAQAKTSQRLAQVVACLRSSASPAALRAARRSAPKSDTACVSAAEPERQRKTLSASGVILSDVRLLM